MLRTRTDHHRPAFVSLRRTVWAGVLLAAFAAGRAGAQPLTTAPAGPDYPRINLAAGYRVDPAWPARPLTYEWGGVSAVTVDTRDRVWSFNRGRVPVQVFSPDGTLVEAWGEGLFKAPHGLRLDREGNVWVTDADLHIVQKFTPKGKLLLTLGTRGEPGEDDRHFNRPTDVAVAPDGDLFVSDGYANNRVAHFDARGRFVKAWGRLGVKPGEFSLPHSIAMDSKGRLYVCDRNNVRVQMFDSKGTFLDEWRSLAVPWHVCVTARDEILVSGSSPMLWGEAKQVGTPPKDQLVLKLKPEGRALELWTFPVGRDGAEQPGDLNWIHATGVDSKGNLYIGDIKGCRLQKFVRVTTGASRET